MAKKHRGGTVGIAWYHAEEWGRLREVASDPDELETTWDEWHQTAERFLKDAARKGLMIERVPVDVEALLSWCEAEGRPLDSSARADYAAVSLARRHRD